MSDDRGGDSAKATTWHHGLIARWWANFKLDGFHVFIATVTA